MAISAKYLNIIFVAFPIFEAMRPIVVTVLVFCFLVPVYMIEIENSNIVISALNAFTAEALYQLDFSLPIATSLLFSVSVLIPVIFLASRGAKFCRRLFAAHGALSSMTPSRGMIASNTTVFGIAHFYATRSGRKIISAIFTLFDNGCLLHSSIIPQLPMNYQVISERRIKDAAAQPALFTLDAPKIEYKQAELV